MVDISNSKPVFVSCGGDDLVIWEEDISQKKFKISKRFPVSGIRSDECISFVCWSDDNRCIACVSTNEVWLINTSDLSLKVCISHKVLFEGSNTGDGAESTATISCVCFMGSGNQILVGSSDGVVRLWDIEKSIAIKSFEGYGLPVSCITCRMKSSLLVVGLENGRIMLHNTSSTTGSTSPTVTLSTATGTEEPTIERVNKVVISPFDQKLLASCGSSGCVRLWSTESHRLLTTFKQPHTKMANDVVFSPYNRKLMASVGGDGKICLYDIQQRKQLTQLTCHVGLCSLLLMKDGVTMVTGGMDGNVYFYNLKNCQKPEYVINGHKGVHVMGMAIQHVIKGSSGGSRKLPGKQMKKASSKVTFQDVDQVLQLQTPSPLQNPTETFATPMLSTTEGTVTLQKELSGIFSPLDVPYSSYVPKSTGQPSTGSSSNSNIPPPSFSSYSTDTTITNGLPMPNNTIDLRPVPPSWPTPLPSHIQSTSISSVFSPLDSAPPSFRPPIIPSSTTTSIIGIPRGPTGTHVIDSSSVSDPAITSSTIHNKPKRASNRSPVSKKPSSPRPNSTSPADTVTTNKAAADSVSLSKLDSTSVIKENPSHRGGGQSDNYSTLMNTNIQSQLPSPDTRSTPIGIQQPIMTDPVSSPPLSTVTTSHSAPNILPLSAATPTPGGVVPPIHMQYLENLIKESREETCSIIHRDIRNLSVSMIRQFSTLENQMVLALTAISERVDMATIEIQQLKHQVDHLTPKY